MALNYETFLRTAFGFVKDGEMLDRFGDPAGIANTDYFTDSKIEAVKAGTGYAMEIMSNTVINRISDNLPDGEITRLEDFTKKVIISQDLNEIDKLITEFRNTVTDNYFDIVQGRISLK